MPYTMDLHTHGGCRRNGQPDPIAAAAVVMRNKYGRLTVWTHRLPPSPTPTNQRAELHAILLALEQAQRKALQMHASVHMNVSIRTDSKYAFGCMARWCDKWMRNGFRNCEGREVANRDLIQRGLLLARGLGRAGTTAVEWVLVARSGNVEADRVVDVVLDEMEPGSGDGESDAPILPSWEDRIGL